MIKKTSRPKSDAPAPAKNNHDASRSLVSIGFFVYNGERYMRQALDSLIAQDYDNFELIISDNASTDATKDICEEYARIDKRIKYSRNLSNLGAGANGVKVLEMAHGEFFMWAGHDDIWDKSYVSKCVSIMQEHPQAVMCCSEINFIDSKGNPKVDSGYRTHKNIGYRDCMSIPERIHELINRMGWYAFYGVWRTEAIRKIDFSASNIQGYGGDVVFLIAMMLIGDFLKVEERLFSYRITDKEKTTEDYLLQIQGSLTDTAFRAYTYLAVELYKIILRSELVMQTKLLIRTDFVNTLSHQNDDWFGRIARENYPQGFRGGPIEKEQIIESFVLQRAEREYTDSLSERKKVLAFFPHNLMPPKTGAHKRCIDLLLSLRAEGHDVTLVSSTLFTDVPWQKESIDKLKAEHGITVLLHHGSPEDYGHLQSHNPQTDWRHFTPPSLVQFFMKVYDTLQPAIVFINYAMWGGLIEDKKYDASVLMIDMSDMVTTNQKMQNHARQAAGNNPASTESISPNFVDEGFYRQIDTAPSPSEFKAYDRFDIVTAIAPAEAALVTANTSRPEVVTIPHVFKANYCKNSYSLSPVFVIGNNIFNFQGYAYFINKILPLVLAVHPNFVLRIVGGACKQLQQVPGIELLGFVPDLASIYADASFAICPLIGGTGQQIKIVEAMSYGVPVVALANVSASSPIIHEKNGFVAENAEEFASYMVMLLNDREQCRKLGEAARQTIFEAHYKNKNYAALHESIRRKLNLKPAMAKVSLPTNSDKTRNSQTLTKPATVLISGHFFEDDLKHIKHIDALNILPYPKLDTITDIDAFSRDANKSDLVIFALFGSNMDNFFKKHSTHPGIVSLFRNKKIKKVLWSYDSHHSWQNEAKYQNLFDRYYIAHGNYIDRFNDVSCQWLPCCYSQFGIDGLIQLLSHKPAITRDLVFPHNSYGIGDRDAIAKKAVGILNKLNVKYHFGPLAYGLPYSKAIQESKICMNISLIDDLNIRNFEAWGLNKILLTNKVPEHDMIDADYSHTYFFDRDLSNFTEALQSALNDSCSDINTAGGVLNRHMAIHRYLEVINRELNADFHTFDIDDEDLARGKYNQLETEKESFCPDKDKLPIAQSSIDIDNHDNFRLINILFVRTDSIGDNILATSMLSHIKEGYPDARITVLCQNHIAELYDASPFVDTVIAFDRLKGYSDETYRNSIVQQLQAMHFDLALNSVYSRESLNDLFAINSAANKRIAFNGNLYNFPASVRDRNNAFYTAVITDNEKHKPELERHRDFLEGIGISVSKLEPAIWFKPEDDEFAEKFFKDNKLDTERTVCLFAGAQNSVRIYQNYGIALSDICKSYGLAVIGLGSSDDSKINIQNLNATGVRTINLSGKTTLRQTAAIMKRCRLAVGAETGLAHMACAMGTPNVIILGGGHFGRFMPYSPLTSIVCLPLECYKCNWICRYDRVHCIRDIRSEVIAEALRQTLEKKSEKPRMFVQGTSLWKTGMKLPKWKWFNEYLDINTVEIIPAGVVPTIPKTSIEHYKIFQEYITSGNFDEAINELEKLLEVYPDFALAYNDLGVIYYNKGDKERALTYYEKAVVLNPENINFQKNLADFYFVELGRTEDAISIYIKVLAAHPEDIEALLAISNFCLTVEKINEANVFCNRVLEIDPENKDALKMIDLLNSKNQSITPEADDATMIEAVSKAEGYLVSAIVSAYNAERFIRGCIEDLEAQTIANRLEIVIVDSCSLQNEWAIVEELQQKYGNIKYIRTDKRETVYAAWNRGIKTASGKYITNANTDDRHRYNAFEVMVNELERKPEIALVYADVIMTEKENETFDRHTPCGNFKWHDWDRTILLEQGCFIGPQPMWRRSVHDEYGYFDESMVTSGDYEFWLRISQTHNFYHINTPLGLYLKSPESIEHGNREKQRQENHQILSLYREAAQKNRIVQYGTLDKSLQSPKEMNIIDIVKKSFISGLTSIVIHSLANLKHLRQCIQELEKYTPEQYEIIFLDYNSPADIKIWLKKQSEAVKHYKYITANRDQSFVNTLNNGISESSGEFIVLLSSDVIVSKNWLSDMLSCLQSAVRPAIVGPMADNVLGHQNVQDANLKSLDEIKAFRERNRYRRILARNLEGFCMLFRRQLVIDIGLLDETFIADKYVFNDFCFRAILAGHINVIAGDVFLHNYGSSMSGNIKIFDEKWTGIDVDTPLGKKVAAFNIIDMADTLNQKRQLDKAIAMFIEGIKYAPDEKAVYYRLAEMLLDAKLNKDALEAVESMPQEMRDDLKRLEIIAYCTEDIEEAGKLADRILAVDKDYAAAINLQGINACKQGNNIVAEDFFRKAIASDPGYGEPYTNLGIMKWAADQKEEALDCLERGFILSPTLTDNVTLYHTAITALEQFDRAEMLFQDAKILHPENKRILFFLIDIFINQDKFDKAMHEIEQAMLDIGIDDGMLEAALGIREKVGIKEIDNTAKNKGSLSLCMIVKNEEQHLTRCLLSAQPAVDEMIIVDTGSTDRTKDIARAFGAKVFDFPWTNDFSEARNYSLSKASGDWILVLDADEVISSLDYAAIEKIIKKKASKPAAYTLVTRNYTNEVNSKGWVANDRKYLREEAGTGWFPSAKVRLFVNDKRIQFQNPVHEFVEGTLEKADIEIKTSDIPVHHYGRFDKAKILAKGKEYFLLGKKKIDQMKDDVKALKELAIQASELGEYVTAVELWKRVIELNPNDAVALLNIGYAYLKLENYKEGLVSSRRAMELDPAMKEAVLNYAGSEFIIGDLKKTISILEKLLLKDSYYPPAMVLIGAAYYIDGQKERSAELFEKLRKKGFDCTEFFDEQIRAFMSQERFEQAFSLLESAIKTGSVNKDTKTLLAECHSKIATMHV